MVDYINYSYTRLPNGCESRIYDAEIIILKVGRCAHLYRFTDDWIRSVHANLNVPSYLDKVDSYVDGR